MRYLALGDSVSIDRYTGVDGGGAVSQFARLIRADVVQDLTHDGYATGAVLESLLKVSIKPDVVTLTVGGNDILQRPAWNVGRHSLDDPDVEQMLKRLSFLYTRARSFHCDVIVNTVYDPTDGDDTLLAQLGMSPAFRTAYEQVNGAIRSMARRRGLLLSDLQHLFTGHGITSHDSWITMEIEPNHAGATAIAKEWHRLFLQPPNGMVLRDRRDGWSFSIGVNDYQFHRGMLSKLDRQWLVLSFEVASPESCWRWIDPALRYSEAEQLAGWIRDAAAGQAKHNMISFMEPEMSFELIENTGALIVLRVCLYHPSAPFSQRCKHGFRDEWTKTQRPLTHPPDPEWTVSVLCRDFTLTPEDLAAASRSLLRSLHSLPPRD